MLKKIFGITLFMAITAVFSCAEAHGTFTWFGLRKDNTEIFINTGTDDKIHPPAHKPHPKKPKHKPKHKPKPKHEPPKKEQIHCRYFWWCK